MSSIVWEYIKKLGPIFTEYMRRFYILKKLFQLAIAICENKKLKKLQKRYWQSADFIVLYYLSLRCNRNSIELRWAIKACGSIAQLGEHLPYKQRVTGSSPVVPTTFGPVVQLVRTLACHARGRRFEPVPGRQFLPL